MSDDAGTLLTGSAGLVEQQIKDWVRRHVCAVSKEHGRCKKIVVRHLNVEKKPIGDVHNISINADPATDGTEIADRVINEIADATLRDANDVKQGIQTYAAYAYYTADPNYCPRKIFRVAADEEFDPTEGGVSEPPNEKGLTTQLMRHLEITNKNAIVGMGFILQTFQKEIEQQRSMNAKFLDQQMETAVFVQDVMNDAHKRRLDEKKADMEMSVYEGVFEHLKVVLPILANRLAGKEVVPSAMPREVYLLSTFLENLSPEQQNALAGMLDSRQMTVLAELLGAYEQRKAKLTGDKPQDDDEPEKRTENGITKKPPNRLAALFEKRTTLVTSKDTRFEVKDAVTRRLEERAERIKNRITKANEQKP